jgi:hypothetical protein
MLHEGLDADDRVVAPVVRLAELPVLHAGGEQRPCTRGELLRARMHGVVAAGLRRGLDDAGVGVLASIRRTSFTRQSPLITLSASSTTM